ncbi:MAG: rhodanese-like domain-containing protein [Planctomycetota bacterium]
MIPTITVQECARRLAAETPPLLLDVREDFELDIARIEGALHIPMAAIAQRLDALDSTREIVVMCHHGVRSAHVCEFLLSHGFEEIMNLEGGIDSWSRQVDPSIARY